MLVNPTDYFLYLPLLPEVAAGILDPRRVTVSLPGDAAAASACVLGEVDRLDLDDRTVRDVDPEGDRAELAYDRALLAAGSVNKLLPIPGVSEYAHGFRSIAEALYLRDHIIRQIELADSTDDPAERGRGCTFVVVGAGYTGTEVAAQGVCSPGAGQRTRGLARPTSPLAAGRPAPRVLPGLDEHLAGPPTGCCASAASRSGPETSVEEAHGRGRPAHRRRARAHPHR